MNTILKNSLNSNPLNHNLLTSNEKEDSEILSVINTEEMHQLESLRLIASENFASTAVRNACGTVLTNKYSEGYPNARYYEGQQQIDIIEQIAIDRAKNLFNAEHANVQPYSGSPANLAVYLAFLKPGDSVLGMRLSHGGHLTHGSKVSITGKHWKTDFYELNKETETIDYDQIRDMAKKNKPQMIIAGHSAYPRFIDFKLFREIADEVGAKLLVDMAHVAGLVAAGVHPSPVSFADAVTTTTHKTLRGPRGGMILCKKEYANAIDKAVFPGIQGGPHNNTTAAIAIALFEAAQAEFVDYAEQTVKNAKALADFLINRGYKLVTGGTDNHLLLIDLRNKNLDGKPVANALDRAGIVANYNSVPWDDKPPQNPSGIRLGTAAMTTRGFKESDFEIVGEWIDRVIDSKLDDNVIEKVATEVRAVCSQFPLP